MDAGTTTYELIPYLENMNIKVVTNGVKNLIRLNEYSIETIFLGGKLKNATNVVVGSITMEQLSKFNFHRCFLGANAYSKEKGFMTPDIEEAMIKELAIKNSKYKYILVDKTKKINCRI